MNLFWGMIELEGNLYENRCSQEIFFLESWKIDNVNAKSYQLINYRQINGDILIMHTIS